MKLFLFTLFYLKLSQKKRPPIGCSIAVRPIADVVRPRSQRHPELNHRRRVHHRTDVDGELRQSVFDADQGQVGRAHRDDVHLGVVDPVAAGTTVDVIHPRRRRVAESTVSETPEIGDVAACETDSKIVASFNFYLI